MILFLGFGWLCVAWKMSWRGLVRNPLVLAVATGWIVVIARDSVRGETARIMLFFFPPCIAAACSNIEDAQPFDWVCASALVAVQSIGMAVVLNLF
jgi:hypothetical protein